MKSAPGIALGILTLVALACATAFHDQPITNNNELFAYLRSFSSKGRWLTTGNRGSIAASGPIKALA